VLVKTCSISALLQLATAAAHVNERADHVSSKRKTLTHTPRARPTSRSSRAFVFTNSSATTILVEAATKNTQRRGDW